MRCHQHDDGRQQLRLAERTARRKKLGRPERRGEGVPVQHGGGRAGSSRPGDTHHISKFCSGTPTMHILTRSVSLRSNSELPMRALGLGVTMASAAGLLQKGGGSLGMTHSFSYSSKNLPFWKKRIVSK
jgi:hypothetical protein